MNHDINEGKLRYTLSRVVRPYKTTTPLPGSYFEFVAKF